MERRRRRRKRRRRRYVWQDEDGNSEEGLRATGEGGGRNYVEG